MQWLVLYSRFLAGKLAGLQYIYMVSSYDQYHLVCFHNVCYLGVHQISYHIRLNSRKILVSGQTFRTMVEFSIQEMFVILKGRIVLVLHSLLNNGFNKFNPQS